MRHATDFTLLAKARRRLGTHRLLAIATLASGMALAGAAPAWAESAPLTLERTIKIPGVPVDPYTDYMTVDLEGSRLFATPLAAKAVAVLDLKTNTVLKMLPVGSPRGLHYSPKLKRLFVADGESGDVKVFSGVDYSLIKTIPVSVGADVITYDETSDTIYVNSGGEEAKMDHSLVTAINVDRMEKLFDIPIPAESLDGATLDAARKILYVNAEGGQVMVVDLAKRQKIATWKLPPGHRNKSLMLDASRSRLYAACRDEPLYGSVIVLDTKTGGTIATLPIGGWTDGIFLDQKRRRMYISAGVGHVDTYEIHEDGTYRRLAMVDSDLLAKTSFYSPELDRYFVSIPHLGNFGSAAVMIYKPNP